jgi:ribonuclease D
MGISDSEALLYIDTQDGADDFLADISGVREIAVDTEGASFHRFIDRIYLLQLSTRERSAIIDPLPIGMPKALGEILQDPDVEVDFHDADYDLRLLHQDYGWHVNRIFDTRIAAQLLGIKAFGLAALLEQFFGVVNSNLKEGVTFLIILLILALRPTGLMGKKEVEKV